MKHLAVTIPILLVAPAAAQRILTTHHLVANAAVKQLRHVGDTNGDGAIDFIARIANTFGNDPIADTTRIMSGATGQPLLTVAAALASASTDVAGIGDVNGDNRSDIALVANGALRVLSGSTGALLHNVPSQPNEFFVATCDLGDFDGNGIPDVAGLAKNSSTNQLVVRLFRGQNGSQLTSLTPLNPAGSWATIRNLGDLSGDGKAELAIATDEGPVYAQRTDTGALQWTLAIPQQETNRVIETIDLDGDGRRELIHVRSNIQDSTAIVYGSNGLPRFTIAPLTGYTMGVRRFVCSLGDLDQDGFADFALSFHATEGEVHAVSGRTGATLWTLRAGLANYLGEGLTWLGDVDGDGVADLASGTIQVVPGQPPRLHVVSGRILAESQPQGGACGGGPFFPQLGATRPILGQPLTIVGQNGPAGANGILVWSLRPLYPSYLGASSCSAYFDAGAGFALAPLTQPQWTLSVPLPLVPQFAGLEVALQDFYSPTTGPLGFDLSNGIWARLGFQ